MSELNEQVQRDISVHKVAILEQRRKLQDLAQSLARAEMQYDSQVAKQSSAQSNRSGEK
jgi:hypothetical protein